jgi:hypothetical protein
MRPLALLLLFAAVPAFGMNTKGFRRSTNIEDRRPAALYPELPQKQLVQFGQYAAGGKFPFLCPGLKAVTASSARMGQELDGAPTLLSLRKAFDDEIISHQTSVLAEVTKDTDACEGARKAQLEALGEMMAIIRKHMDLLTKAHAEPYGEARKALLTLADAQASPTIGDRINNALSKCPTYTKLFDQAATAYSEQVRGLGNEYMAYFSHLSLQSSRVGNVVCATTTSATTATETTTSRRNRVPLPRPRPR